MNMRHKLFRVSYLFIRFSISCSATVGSASVVVSPRFSSSSRDLAEIRLIIFPDLVFGRPGANCIISGLANTDIFLQRHQFFTEFHWPLSRHEVT